MVINPQQKRFTHVINYFITRSTLFFSLRKFTIVSTIVSTSVLFELIRVNSDINHLIIFYLIIRHGIALNTELDILCVIFKYLI